MNESVVIHAPYGEKASFAGRPTTARESHRGMIARFAVCGDQDQHPKMWRGESTRTMEKLLLVHTYPRILGLAPFPFLTASLACCTLTTYLMNLERHGMVKCEHLSM